ncbi:MAG: PAS-domain containing protein [Methyloligellaceae bacterium]
MDDQAPGGESPARSDVGTAQPEAWDGPVAKFLISTLDGSSDGVIILDAQMRFVFCNATMRRLCPDLQPLLTPGRLYGEILREAAETHLWRPRTEADADWIEPWLADLSKGQLEGSLLDTSGQLLQARGAAVYGNNFAVYHTPAAAASESDGDSTSSAASMSDLVSFMDQGVLSTAPDDTFQIVSPRAARILELPPELLERGIPRRAMVEFRAARGDFGEPGDICADAVMDRFAPGQKASMEVATPSGRIVRTDSNPLPDGGSVFTLTDITELRHQLEEIEKNKSDLEKREAELVRVTDQLDDAYRQIQALLSNFEAIIEHIDYGVVFMDEELRADVVNRAFRQMWGLDEELADKRPTMRELIEFNRYNDIYDVDDTEWDDWIEKRIEAVRKGPVPPTVMHRKDGKIYSYQAVALPDGRRMLTYFDLTEINQKEVETRRKTEALEVVLNNTRHGLTWFDSDLTLRAWNQKFRELLMFPEDEFELGDPFAKFIRFNAERGEYGPGDVQQLVVERVDIAKKFEPHAFDRDRGDGTMLRIEGYPVPEGGWVTVYTDVTEDLRQQQALEEEKERAKAASQAKSEFLANMSHEIRTPLNGILGMSELMLTTKLDSRQHNFADTILKSSMSLLTIINDILDFSRIEAGKIQLEPKPFDLRVAIEDVATMVSSQAAEKGVEVLVRFKPDTPQDVCADAGRIRQIVTNLLGNAVKFTDTGHVLVEVDGRREGKQAELVLSVVDTGIGIPHEKLESVFETFQQVDNSSTRQYGGTGLGLAISKRIVKALGGEIGVESEVDRGSRFWVKLSLPLAPAPKRTTPEAFGNLEGLRVLVVDDNDVNRRILEEQLAGWSLKPTAVGSGGEALTALADAARTDAPFELAILDHQMPEMDGAELLKHIKASSAFCEMPLIVLTSVGKGDAWARFRELGVSGLLEKPARSSLLLETILETVAEAAETSGNATASKLTSDQSGARWTILVAEDHEMNRTLIEHMLNNTDYRPVFAEDGARAVEAYKEIVPDLVFMDISMPKMDGYQATRLIRGIQEQDGRRVPIVGVTAHAFEEDRRRCLDSGMDDHLPKPISMSALNTMLERWLPQASGETASVA